MAMRSLLSHGRFLMCFFVWILQSQALVFDESFFGCPFVFSMLLSAWSDTPCLGYRSPRCAQAGIMSRDVDLMVRSYSCLWAAGPFILDAEGYVYNKGWVTRQAQSWDDGQTSSARVEVNEYGWGRLTYVGFTVTVHGSMCMDSQQL